MQRLKHFHVWESGTKQVYSPTEAVIGYLRNEHYKTRSDIDNTRCFAVLDAIGILCDLENNRRVEYLDAMTSDEHLIDHEFVHDLL